MKPSNPYLKKGAIRKKQKTYEKSAKIERLLIDKGVVTKEALDRIIEIYETDIGPMNGSKVVAKAWTDEDYKQRLMTDATKAIAELGLADYKENTWW